MNTAIVIPARFASKRLPGKPLISIAGKTLIERTWRIASTVYGVNRVIVATDDQRIFDAVKEFGGEAMMTDPNHSNGSERVFEVATRLDPRPEVVLNLQGDAPLVPPWIPGALIDEMRSDPDVRLATPVVRLNWNEFGKMSESRASGKAGGTLAVFDQYRDALYFSKGMIPFPRKRDIDPPPLFRHIGLYAYRYETLERYVGLEATPLEKMEGLEQLRALEHGIPIRCVEVDYRGRTAWSVDKPEDVPAVEEIIAREGELT